MMILPTVPQGLQFSETLKPGTRTLNVLADAHHNASKTQGSPPCFLFRGLGSRSRPDLGRQRDPWEDIAYSDVGVSAN